MKKKNDIYVPGLRYGKNLVLPKFYLGKYIEYRKNEENIALSAFEYYNQIKLPTLAELRHAFSVGSQGYKQSISLTDRGEWTSTFLQDGKMLIERPEKFVDRNGMWVAEGGKKSSVELPDYGWVLKYDNITGLPKKTSPKKDDAKNIFGDDASYFSYLDSGLMPIMRYSDSQYGPFYIYANYELHSRPSLVGGRSCHRCY